MAVHKRIRVKVLAVRFCCRPKRDKTRWLQIPTKLVQQADIINEDLAPMGLLSIHDADEDRFTSMFLEPKAMFLHKGVGVFAVGYVADDLAVCQQVEEKP